MVVVKLVIDMGCTKVAVDYVLGILPVISLVKKIHLACNDQGMYTEMATNHNRLKQWSITYRLYW